MTAIAMGDHVAAVQSLLTPLGWTVYYVAVPDAPTYPYLLLTTTSGRLVNDAVAGPSDLDETLQVTAVAGDPRGVLTVQAAVRAALSAQPVVAGRVCWLDLIDSRPVALDRDVKLPGTSRYPAYGVDVYRLRSTSA